MSFKGAGTASSPFAIESDDEGDSEEVFRELILDNSNSTSLAGSPATKLQDLEVEQQKYEPRNVPAFGEGSSDEEQDQRFPGVTDATRGRGTKRQRSDSVASRESGPVDMGADNDGQPNVNDPAGRPTESRKARKRRRKAEKNREMYLERLNRLTHNPDLVPPQFSGFDLFANVDYTAFLPPLQGAGTFDFRYPAPYYPAPQHQAWPAFTGHVLAHQDESSLGAAASSWNVPAADLFQGYSSISDSPMIVDTLPSSTVNEAPVPPKPVQTIGVEPDHDPNSKHGLFTIPGSTVNKDKTRYIPTPACTLVLEQLPKQHRSVEYINSWALHASGAQPSRVLIDGSGAKALVEFHSAEAARKAWASPRLGARNLGLKTHQLKGIPREDLIKAYWYRVDGIGAGVGEIEEGEIEEAGEKDIDLAQRKETKKEKKARLRQEKHKREQERLSMNGYSTATVSSQTSVRPMPSMAIPPLNNSLPPRPIQFPPVATAPPAFVAPTYLANGQGTSYANQSAYKDSEDMDLGSPISPVLMSLPPNGPTLPTIPNSSLNRPTPSTFSFSKVPSEPRAMKNIPTEPRSLKRGSEQHKRDGPPPAHQRLDDFVRSTTAPLPQSNAASTLTPTTPTPPVMTEAMEAKLREQSLREQVLKSRKMKGKAREDSNVIITIQAVSSTSSELESYKSASPTAALDAADSFIAAAVGSVAALPPKPPPMAPRANTTSALQQMKADLAERERQALAELRDLQEKDRSRKEEAQHSRFPTPGVVPAVKPSSKINLDYVPTSQSEYFWPNEQHNTILIVSDDEDEDDDEA